MKIDFIENCFEIVGSFVNMRDDKENIIVKKSMDFSLHLIEFTDKLLAEKRFSLANQLFKAGTSIGANIKEAQNAESKNDFIHKMKLAAKEADEAEYWLELCDKIGYDVNLLLSECREIQRILSKIISTAKNITKIDLT